MIVLLPDVMYATNGVQLVQHLPGDVVGGLGPDGSPLARIPTQITLIVPVPHPLYDRGLLIPRDFHKILELLIPFEDDNELRSTEVVELADLEHVALVGQRIIEVVAAQWDVLYPLEF